MEYVYVVRLDEYGYIPRITNVKETLQHTLGGFIVHSYLICNKKSKNDLVLNSLPTLQKKYFASIKLQII